MSSHAHIAILFFSRSAASEAEHKNIGGFAQSLRAFKAFASLRSRSMRLLKKLDFPVFESSELQQRGIDFGQKLSCAMSEVYNYGYDKILIVGGDCPQLSLPVLRKALRLLQNQSLVLGPTRQGGAYLIGVDKELFQAAQWRALPWQSDIIYKSLLNIQDARQRAQLPFLRDINNWNDLMRLKSQLLSLKGWGFFQGITSTEYRLSDETLPITYRGLSFGLRAPPALV